MSDPGPGHQIATGGANFKETPYHDQSWEIVGEVKDTSEFEPMSAERLPDRVAVHDPIFADYGGRTPPEIKSQWHLPEELSSNPEVARKRAAERSQPLIQGVPVEEAAAQVAAALEQGRSEGRAAAMAEAAAEQDKLAAKVDTLIADMTTQVRADLGGIEKAGVELALEISRRIVAQAVELNPEYVVQVIKESLLLAEGSVVHEVRVSPQDLEFIEVIGVAQKLDGFDGTWRFVPDETIKAGCVVKTSSGEVDYQLDKAWERIKENIIRATR